MLTTYLKSLTDSGKSNGYIRKMKNVLTNYGGDNHQQLIFSLAERATQSTVDDVLNRLRIFGKFREEAGAKNPFTNIVRPRAVKVARDRATFTAKEVRTLTTSKAIPEHRRVLWGILAWTGLRPVEASRMTAQHIVQSGSCWELRLPAEFQKSRRPDVIELDAGEARGIKAHAPLVRCSVDHLGRFLEVDMKAGALNLKQSGTKRTPYDLRSFFVSELFRQGLDPETVRTLARHRRIETTLSHYTRFRSNEAGASRKLAKAKSLSAS